MLHHGRKLLEHALVFWIGQIRLKAHGIGSSPTEHQLEVLGKRIARLRRPLALFRNNRRFEPDWIRLLPRDNAIILQPKRWFLPNSPVDHLMLIVASGIPQEGVIGHQRE